MMKRIAILSGVAVVVIMVLSFLCIDQGMAQPTPTILPEFVTYGDTVITNVNGEHLVVQYNDDSIWINPAIGFYWAHTGGTVNDTLLMATLDSIANALGRFSVTAGMWALVDGDTVGFVHPDSGDTTWYMQSTLQSGVAYLKPYANNDGTPYGVIHLDSLINPKHDTTTVFILKVSDNWFLPISPGTAGYVLTTDGTGTFGGVTWGDPNLRASSRAGDGLTFTDSIYAVDTDKFAVRDGSVGNEDSLNPCHAMYSFCANYGALEGYYGYQWIGEDSALYSLLLNDTNTTIYLSGDSTPTLQIQGPIESYEFIVLNADSAGNDGAIKVRDTSGNQWAIGFNETTEQWTFDGRVAIDSTLNVTYWGVFDSVFVQHLVGNATIYGVTGIHSAGWLKADSFYTRAVVCTSATAINIANGAIADSSLAVDYLPRNWTAGQILYVPCDSSLQTYIDSADSNWTLLLGSGTMAITDTILIDKPLNIVGRGRAGFVTDPVSGTHGTLISSSTDSVVAFRITANNVRISNLSIDLQGVSSMGVETATDLQGLVFMDMDVVVNCAGPARGFSIYGSDAIMRDVTFYITSSDSLASGVYFWNDASTTINATLQTFNVTGTVLGATYYSYAFCCWNINDADTVTMILNNSVCRAMEGTPIDVAVAATSTTTNNAVVETNFCTLEGDDWDAYQTGTNSLYIGASALKNNTVSGTVTPSLNIASEGAVIGGSLTFAAASITDTSGAISFGNENLTTTGRITGGDIAATDSIITPTAIYGATVEAGTGTFTNSLTIPCGPNLTTTLGRLGQDSDDHALEVYDSVYDVSMLLVIPETKAAILLDPDNLPLDTVPISQRLDPITSPAGIKLLKVHALRSDTTAAYTFTIEEWTPAARVAYVDTITIAANTPADSSIVFNDADIAVGNQLRIGLPATDLDMLTISYTYYVKEND